MNKLTKASIAGGAAILLLMGGAGTLASWNATANAGASSAITAGNLEIDDATGDWVGGTPALIVPGDTVTYTATFPYTATGDNLVVRAALTDDSISPVNSADTADVALADYLNANKLVTVRVDGQPFDLATDTLELGTGTIEVSVALTFPKSSNPGDENGAKEGQVRLDQFSVTLTQQ